MSTESVTGESVRGAASTGEPVLTANGIVKTFVGSRGPVHALNGVDVEVRQGQCVAVVGETGSGKSTLGRILLGLEAADAGTVKFMGRSWSSSDVRIGRSDERRLSIQPVFQDPRSSLNPRRRVGRAVGVALAARGVPRSDRKDLVLRALNDVGLTPAAVYLDRFPRQLSGGQQQRVTIARALSVQPKVIIADEPTSGLDVSLRASVVNLLERTALARGIGILLITHDLRLAQAMASTVLVMQAGRVVESGPVSQVLSSAATEAYTKRLLEAAFANLE